MARARGAGLDDLLAHSDWLGRLAHRLAGPADAEDAVQDTWLAAQRSPPDPDRPPRPWLAEVLRNLLRARWQSDQRRHRREKAQAELVPDREAALDTLYERVELQRIVAERVMALEEPVRIVLLLRYFEGHDSARIGQILGLPPGTVRWRLKQALDHLRADMDARFGGDRRAWALVLAPTAALPRPVALASATGLAPGALLAGALALLLGGGLGVGLGAWSGAEPGEGSAMGGGPRAGSSGARAVAPRDDERERDARGNRLPRWSIVSPHADRGPRFLSRPAGATDALDPCGPQGTAALTGLVRLRGRPEDDVIVVANPIDPGPVERAAALGSDPDAQEQAPAKAKTGDHGRFCFPTLPAGRFVLTANGHDEGSNRSPEIEVRADRMVRDLVIDLQPTTAGVFGRVVDAGGEGIARARIRARTAGAPPGAPLAFEAESGCLGRYRIQLPTGLYSLEIEAAGYGPTRFSLQMRSPAIRDVRLFPAHAATAGAAGPAHDPR